MTKNRLAILGATALLAMSIAPIATVASAVPVADGLAIKNAAPTNIETVQWRGRGWRGGGRSWRGRGPGIGLGAGLLGGMIIGGMLAAPYDYGPYYAPGRYYVVPGPGYGDDAIGYCMQRFQSYDPRSGTYLGYDGFRHPCP